MDYKSVKIADEVILVESQEGYKSWVTWREVKGHGLHQAYVVDAGNKKMLESAKDWAQCITYDESLSDAYYDYRREHRGEPDCDAEAKKIWDKYQATRKCFEGVEHRYKNGQFELTLCDSANESSQGGKLSFWNCLIKCPDGREFLVGINADILLELLVSNTFVDGTCQSKVWLGRIGGKQVGAFTENMPLYAQAQKDEAKRQEAKKANDKYVPGDIVKTLKDKNLYIGSVYQYYKIDKSDWRGRDYYLVIYDKPKLVHVFRNYWTPWHSNDEELSKYYEVRETKVKRIVDGHVDLDYTALDYIKKHTQEQLAEHLERDAKDGSRYAWDDIQNEKMYGDKPDCDMEEILAYLRSRYKEICGKWYYSLDKEYKVISEAEWKKLQQQY